MPSEIAEFTPLAIAWVRTSGNAAGSRCSTSSPLMIAVVASASMTCFTRGVVGQGRDGLAELLGVHQSALHPVGADGERRQQCGEDDEQCCDDAPGHGRRVGLGTTRRPVVGPRGGRSAGPWLGVASTMRPGRRIGPRAAIGPRLSWAGARILARAASRALPVRPARGRRGRCSLRSPRGSDASARPLRARGPGRAGRPRITLAAARRRRGDADVRDPLGAARHREDNDRVVGESCGGPQLRRAQCRVSRRQGRPRGHRGCQDGRSPHGAVHRRGSPLHPHPAGRPAARGGERLGHPRGGDHREPVVRDHLAPAEQVAAAHPAAAG